MFVRTYPLLILAAVWAAVVQAQQSMPVPPSPGFPGCSICGPGFEVSTPDLILNNVPQTDPISCGAFQSSGQLGFIDPVFCPAVQALATPCGCVPVMDNSTMAPITAAPVMATMAPDTAAPTPAPTIAATPAPTIAATPAPTMSSATTVGTTLTILAGFVGMAVTL